MAQIIKFFGWLLMAIGGTFAFVANVAQGVFNGWDSYWAQVEADPVGMAVMAVFLLPGAIVLSIGILTGKIQRFRAAKRTHNDKPTEPHNA